MFQDPASNKAKTDEEGDLDIVQDVKTQPLLSSFSDSDTEKRPEPLDSGRARRKKRPTRLCPDSDDSDHDQPEIIEIQSSPEPVPPPEPPPEPEPPLSKLPRTPSGNELEPKVHLKRKCKERSITSTYSPEKTKKKSSRSIEKESPSSKRPRKRVVKPPVTPSDTEDEGGKRRRIICASDSGDESWGTTVPPSRARNLRRSIKGSSSDRNKIDSSSEDEAPPIAQSPIKPVARVAPAMGKRPPLGSSESDAEKEESPPKLDSEGQSIQDKKKNDTLRKLFSKRDNEGGLGKGGKGKGGKGGKGKGMVAVVNESDSTPHHSPKLQSPKLQSPKLHLQSPKIEPPRVPSPHPTQDEKIPELVRTVDKFLPLPKLVFIDGKPSLTCKIDLSRLSHIPSKKRSQEVRTHTEIPDTRQAVDKGKKIPKDIKSDKRDRKHLEKHRSRDDKSKKKKSDPPEVKEEPAEQKQVQAEVLKRLTPDVRTEPIPVSSR